MKLVRFDAPEVFQEKVRDYLVENEAENNLPLGILNGLIAGEYRDREPYLAILEKSGRIALVIMCTPPHQVIFSYHEQPPGDDSLELALTDLADCLGDDFVGITGNKVLASRLKDLWEELTGRRAELHMEMRIYKLEELIPPRDTAGSMRPIEKKDRRLLVDWYEGFYREASQIPLDRARARRQVDIYMQADPKLRGLMVWENRGIPVSMAGYAGPTPNGIRIGAVYTPPNQRKKGYASAVTAGLSQQLLDLGYSFCFLFTDLRNPTSNHIYQKIGYEPVCDVDQYDFK